MDIKISIVFCGGCNPRIDRGQIANTLRNELAAMGYKVGYNCRDDDFIIFLNGCTASCALRHTAVARPCVIVAADTVDRVETLPSRLVAEVLEKVRMYNESLDG